MNESPWAASLKHSLVHIPLSLFSPLPKHRFPVLLHRVGAPLLPHFPLKPEFPLLIHRVGATMHLPFPLKHQFPLLIYRVGAPLHPPFPLSARRMFSDGRLERSCLLHTAFHRRWWVWPVWRPAVGFALLPFSFFLLLPFLPPFHPFLRYYLSKFNCFSLINIEVIIALQYCVGFCHTSTWISHGCMYVPSLLNLPSISQPISPVL